MTQLGTARATSTKLPESYDGLFAPLYRGIRRRWPDGNYPEWLMRMPNTLTWSRVAIVPLAFLMGNAAVNGRFWLTLASLAVITLLFATDAIDGGIARTVGSVSSKGKMLDPTIDKLATVAIVGVWIWACYELFPHFAPLALRLAVIRAALELVIAVVSAVSVLIKQEVAADKVGKYKANFDWLILIFGGLSLVMGSLLMSQIATITLVVTIVLAIPTAIGYIRHLRTGLKQRRNA